MTAVLRARILGCGSSGGVPRLGGDWGDCDAEEPKNRRTRCSLLLQRAARPEALNGEGATHVLVDTSPDMRAQLLAAATPRLDAVLYTHDHADQTHGVDDLRVLAMRARTRIPVYMDAATRASLTSRFAYCFRRRRGSLYPPILEARPMPAVGETAAIDGPGGALSFTPFMQDHGPIHSLGFRFGPLAYTSDAVGLPEESFALLEGVDTWIVDALRRRPHKTHAHLEMTLSWIARLRPRRAILTNMHVDMDYATLRRELPAGVEPAFDGMELDFALDA